MRLPFLEKNNMFLLKDCKKKIVSIRTNSSVLAICAQPTQYSWLGVNVATKSLFPDCTFEIPQYYSNSILNNVELKELSKFIISLEFEQIVFSGFAPFYSQLIDVMYQVINLKIIYHGFLSELSDNSTQKKSFKQMIQYAKDRKISAIGFVKKGLALSINKMYKIPTFEIVLPNNSIIDIANINYESINIGCLVNTSFRKNIHNQAMAALMVEDSKVHIFKTDELSYLPQERIISHSLMNHDVFISLLGSMSVNLHVTLSESWGQVLSESISQGVPCISAYTSSFFDYDEDLKQKLVVDGFDDSWFIFKKIEAVLSERDLMSQMCILYAKRLNVIAKERKIAFLDA
jgi:hypothetical protein